MSGPLTTYNTAIISKPFSPTQFTGLELWLRGDHGVIADSNGRVSEWRDYSGKQRHVTQASIAMQPLFTPNAFQGMPAIQFSSNRMDILESLTASNIDNCSMFTVLRYDSIDSSEDIPIVIGKGSISGGIRAFYRAANSGSLAWGNWGNAYSSSNLTWSVGNFQAYGLTQSSQNIMLIKGQKTETATVNSPVTTTQNYWGIGGSSLTGFGSYYTNCTIGEVIIYNRAVNPTERLQIMNYLKNRWQTPA